MPFDDPSIRRRLPARVRVEPSAAIELSWLVIACSKRSVVLHLPDELTTRADTFWDDGLGLQPELLVLAGQLGCLTGPSVGPLLELDRHTLPRPPDLPLATEEPAVREAVRQRLSRLRAARPLRRDYAALLSDLWAAAAPEWTSTGLPAVQRAAARLQASLDHGLNPIDLIPEQHVSRREPYLDMTRAAVAGGSLLLTPSYFAGNHGHVLDLPGVYSVAIGTGVSPDMAARRTDAERVASGLKLLSDPTRLLILTELDQEPTTVGDLARRVGVAQPTASVHVRQLRDAGLLQAAREGATVRYRLQRDAVQRLLDDAGSALLAPTE